MNILEIAREIWGTDNWTPEQMARLERFREAVVQELVAGSGEPFTARAAHDSVWDDYYTADQLAGAVARERERCAKVCESFNSEPISHASVAAVIRSGE